MRDWLNVAFRPGVVRRGLKYAVVVDAVVVSERPRGTADPERSRRLAEEQSAEHRENALFDEMNPGPVLRVEPDGFAVGDVRTGSTKRVASAVGEGASAVGMVHKYLESV